MSRTKVKKTKPIIHYSDEFVLNAEEIKFIKEFYRGLKEYSEDHGWNSL